MHIMQRHITGMVNKELPSCVAGRYFMPCMNSLPGNKVLTFNDIQPIIHIKVMNVG